MLDYFSNLVNVSDANIYNYNLKILSDEFR